MGAQSRGGIMVWLGGMLLAAVGLMVLRQILPKVAGLHEDMHVVVAGYSAGLSIIYGVLLAFTVVVVWEQLNHTRRLIEEEGARIEALWRVVGRFEEQTAASLRADLRAYAESTATGWRHELDARSGDTDPAGSVLLRLWRSLVAVTPRSAGEETVHGYALEQFEELNRVRSKRRGADHERLHPVMWTLLVVGGMATTSSMFFFRIDSVAVHAVLSALLGGGLGFILFLIHDLDDPFDGVWRLDAAPIERAVRVPGFEGAGALA